jgi:hypothetical protein
VRLAGGPLGSSPATLLVRSRRTGALAGRLGVTGAVGGPLLAVDPVDGGADPLAVGPLGGVVGLGAKGPIRIRDVVGVPVLLYLGRGLAPGPPTPSRRRQWTQRLEDMAGPVSFDRKAGGPPLPGQGSHDLPILRAELGVGLQPAVAALLVLTKLPLPVMGPVGLAG